MATNPKTNPSKQAQPDPAQCRVCREEIKKGAKLCRHCSSYQSAWKNWLPHIGGGIALTTFVASVAISGADIFDRFKKPDLEVLYLKWPAELAVVNNGGEKVWLEYLEIRGSQPNYYANAAINRSIEKDEVVKIDLAKPGILPEGGVIIRSRSTFPKIQSGEAPIYFLKNAKQLERTASYRLKGIGTISFRPIGDQEAHLRKFNLEGYLIQLPPIQQNTSSN